MNEKFFEALGITPGPYRKTAREAAIDYDVLALKHNGKFAMTNKKMGLLDE